MCIYPYTYIYIYIYVSNCLRPTRHRASQRLPGPLLGSSGRPLAPSGPPLRAPRTPCGLPWAPFGALGTSSESSPDPLWALLGALWRPSASQELLERPK